MSTINKVPASAGAEWLLAGFALLKRAPVPLIGMALLWQFLALIAGLIAIGVPSLGIALQIVLILAQPLFLGGLMWVIRELDEGRAVVPSLLLQPARDGRGLALLLSSLVPQLGAFAAMFLSLALLIGPSGVEQLIEVTQRLSALAQAGQAADPALLQSLPVFRLTFWMLVLLPAFFVAMLWLIFLVVPEIVFSGSRAVEALRKSFLACARNWTAMLMFYLLAIVAGMVLAVCATVLIATLQLVGAGVLAGPLVQLAMAVLLPIYVASTYYAWRHMVADTPVSGGGAPQASTHIEV
nr:BPSS1780 family membrane protein [uncultured Pseudoxanthomonas sp.]